MERLGAKIEKQALGAYLSDRASCVPLQPRFALLCWERWAAEDPLGADGPPGTSGGDGWAGAEGAGGSGGGAASSSFGPLRASPSGRSPSPERRVGGHGHGAEAEADTAGMAAAGAGLGTGTGPGRGRRVLLPLFLCHVEVAPPPPEVVRAAPLSYSNSPLDVTFNGLPLHSLFYLPAGALAA